MHSRYQQWTVISLLISTHEILNISGQSTILKFNYTALIHSYSLQRWFISIGCKEFAYNINIKLMPFKICSIHIFKKVFIIFRNESSDLNHSLKFTVVAFTTKEKCLHTYIIGHYNPSVRIIDLVSHTTYVVCVNFIQKWSDLQFKDDCERQIFWETVHVNFYFLSEEEIAEEILFVFRFDVWPGTRTLAFCLINQHSRY